MKKKKNHWFETLCTADARYAQQNGNKKGGKGTRRTVTSRSAGDPFDQEEERRDDFPPFEAEEPIGDSLFEDLPKDAGDGEPSSDPTPDFGRSFDRDGAEAPSGASSRSSRSRGRSGTRPAGSGSSPRKTTATSRSSTGTGKRGTGKGAPASSGRGGPEGKPAQKFYRVLPYLMFGFGALLAVGLLLSCIMSGGSFSWTTDTHPFRVVGYYMERTFFGLFGYGYFLLPFGLMYVGGGFVRRKAIYAPNGKLTVMALIMALFAGMIHACMIGAGSADGALNTYAPGTLFSYGGQLLGGGVLGGWLGWLLYRLLGVIGTVLVVPILLAFLLMLFFGVTPAGLWRSWKTWYADYTERRRAIRQKEAELREEEKKRQLVLFEESMEKKAGGEIDEMTAAKVQRRVEKQMREEREREAAAAMREAERSDRRESKGEKGKKQGRTSEKRASVPTEETAPLNPTDALLRRAKGRKADAGAGSDGKTAEPGTAEFFREEETPTPSPVEEVTELTQEQVRTREEAYARTQTSHATMVTPEEEERNPFDDESMVTYPDRAEMKWDGAEEEAVGEVFEAPPVPDVTENTPAEEEDADLLPEDEDLGADTSSAPQETTFGKAEDYQSGFDYSMESSPEAEEDSLVETTEAGGVAIRVEHLSQEERERGEKVAEPSPEEEPVREYVFPKIDLLNPPKKPEASTDAEIRQKMEQLRDTLGNFKVRVDNISYVCGPSVTRYEVKPAPGVRVRAISNLSDDIAMSLAASEVRIEAPIPGKMAVGIEIPNDTRETVFLRGLIDSEEFRNRKSRLSACLGLDVAGAPIIFDIVKMPHLLVAGTTGSGKSVCINSIIMSLLYKAKPDEVKLILIDPKTVEFSIYREIPHLMAPILCDAKRAAAALNLAVLEMEKRFQMIREVGVRDIAGYNAITGNDRYEHPYMPQLVIIIDELADLMMTAKDEVETSICRLAQKARAAGIHLIIGTQRPSVDVITGLIKANIPSRIAFTVMSQVDSRTILDVAGAEKLIGRGDMLYMPIGSPKPLRVQGAFVSDDEVERVVEYVRRNNDQVRYDQAFLDNLDREAEMIGTKRTAGADDDEEGAEGEDGMDPKVYEALRIAIDNKRISTSLLQRKLSIGYGRAAKIVDQMERMHFVGPAVGNKPREILISEQAYQELMVNREV